MADIKNKLQIIIWRFGIRIIVSAISVARRFLEFVSPRTKRLPNNGIKVLLTGTFYSDNWIITHLRPMALASRVGEVRMVSTRPVPKIDGVTAIYPSRRTIRIVGPTIARFITLTYQFLKWNPDIVGGFHILLNAMVAQLLARLGSKHCIYFCGGGVREVEGGGYKTENRLFRKLRYSSAYIEHRLIYATMDFDFLITMGSSVREFFVKHGAKGVVTVVPGGFDAEIYSPKDTTPEYDIITVGRLSSVKRVELLVDAIDCLKQRGRTVSALIVGDGPSMRGLKELADRLGLSEQIEFVGWQSAVENWLRRCKIFTLTSESEGLSQAMIQAMLCGLPAVVSDVGDLSDLVQNERSGILVTDQSAEGFASAYEFILGDVERTCTMSRDARQAALGLEVNSVARRWDKILGKESK